MSLQPGAETIHALLPNNAVFTLPESAMPQVKYQKTSEGTWFVGFTRHPNRDVRSGPRITSIAADTFAVISELLADALPYVDGAQKLHEDGIYPKTGMVDGRKAGYLNT